MVIVKQQRRGLLGCLHSLYGRATIAAGAVATIARVCSRLQRQGRSGGLSSGRGRHHFLRARSPAWRCRASPLDPPPVAGSDRRNFDDELQRIISQLRPFTSIVQWQPFNESWGAYDEPRIAALVKTLDPTRLVDINSGSNFSPDSHCGDCIDDHIYTDSINTRPPDASRVAVLGEFGGLGLAEGFTRSP